MNISCIIFDLDGTLVDSEGLCNQAFLDLLPELDCSLDEMITRYRGQKLALILADIEKRIGRKLPADFEKHYRARISELFDTELDPMPVVPEESGK
ncbi:MAG: HAD hydrolase-like protein [Verrucomicrobiales bacterium]|nr:HAD hydrolase-like protein [Verrucomicrobiales bacterium]